MRVVPNNQGQDINPMVYRCGLVAYQQPTFIYGESPNDILCSNQCDKVQPELG